VLELARELFERAGYGREKLDGSRTAVLLGAKDNNYLRNHYGSFEPASLKNMIANSIANMMAARVSDFYNLKGAAKTVDTACSSSLVAVHDACQSIRTGEADMAVAGGICLLVDPFYHVGFSRAEVLSDDGRMYVFDERAKGFVLGEGAGLVLLKDYDEAQRDGDRILGVVLASAVNNDGRTMGITVPSADGQKAVIEEALGRSGVSPEAIGYLEAHGTGTLLGDPIEVKAASDVYRKYTSATGYCALGSVKSNMGHSLTAAGIASLIKVLLSLQHGQIPATIHCTRPHPRFRFDASPFFPNTTLREWKPRGDRRVAAVTSLGFGGTNCHLIVADR
jgi:acyl transferase domain-containing protein